VASTTFIDTNQIPHGKLSGSGEFVEIMNDKLAGAKNGVATLHWLKSGERLDLTCDAKTHQLVYLMEGEGTISLNSKDHQVGQGAGIYLGPSESARVTQSGSGTLKLFHLTASPKN